MISLDCEWNVCKVRGWAQRKVSLVQIFNGDTVGLFRINNLTKSFRHQFPRVLADVIESEAYLKTGMNIRGDAAKLHRCFPPFIPLPLLNHINRDFQLIMAGYVELSAFSKLACPEKFTVDGKLQRRSLKLLSQVLLGKDIDKSENLRVGVDWETGRLEAESVKYAANDVVAGFEVFKELLRIANTLPIPETYNHKSTKNE
ncbi:hypothetical protein HDU83_004640 [Entophlyctis luteolus]|nr:hypothetical protein HDU83_004640 [Entophlyctis luteolus]